MTPVPVVVVCDAETDDAIAILLAALDPGLDLLGVSTASRQEAAEVRALVASGGVDVAVHAGVDGLVAAVRDAAEPVTLVTTGPLTNLAAALAADPSLPRAVRRLVVLGGTHREPGVTPYADRNVWADPQAAADVLAAPFRDVLLVTADATASVALDGADLARLRALGTPAARAAADLAAARLDRGARVHDPLAVAAVREPGLLTTLRAAVRVECTDPTTYGATRFAAEVDERRGRMSVAVGADKARYVEVLVAALGPS
ncbi:nucleoside hydrolase [Nocardioides daeguensis]|uniref:nucleoside hydrolase n=1 Tax=Nocardioides daeguensis TaxID=908359 RepID=UPI001C48A369|nr:nucleoside hydrolase [Nocardioides daeguensis]MBV6725804.1 nucleoside hydrolase [Nocardioides daeguensis]MCR1772681.1 nucleoside hydrolase [Nocardioides daeguensis]